MEIIKNGLSLAYEDKRKIFNRAFDYKPEEIIYCENALEVSNAIKYYQEHAKKFNFELRVRSGGHHHGGLSSVDNGLIIDVSKIKTFQFTLDPASPNTNSEQLETKLWVGAGLLNHEIKDKLAEHQISSKDSFERERFIPIGSCENVGIGGLVLGGGWNMFARKYGLVCDSLEAIKVVLADGTIDIISQKNNPKLFKAMKGSGGGNFAIAIEYLFNTFPKKSFFTFQYELKINTLYDILMKYFKKIIIDDPENQNLFSTNLNNNEDLVRKIINDWWDYQISNEEVQCNNDITSFLRILHIKEKLFGVRIAGYVFASDKAKAKEEVMKLIKDFHEEVSEQPLLKIQNFFKKNIQFNLEPNESELLFKTLDAELKSKFESNLNSLSIHNISENKLFLLENHSITRDLYSDDIFELLEKKKSLYNCSVPMAHKVSSALITTDGLANKDNTINTILEYLSCSENEEKFSKKDDCYNIITFHALGGKVKEIQNNCFAYKNSTLMLQFQAWWNSERKVENEEWVDKFRKKLCNPGYFTGGFINFYDQNLVVDDYYSDQLSFLEEVSLTYDKNDIFQFRKRNKLNNPHK